MALPSPASKANLDEITDDPKLARPDLADLVDKFNSLLTVLGNIVELDAADGIKDDGAGGIAVDLGTDPGLEIISAKLRAKTTEGIQRLAAGLALNVNGLTENAGIDGANDFVAYYDASAGGHRKIKPNDLAGAVTGSINQYVAATAPTGWVLMEGGTIGSATSGASVRANADTEQLFLLLWDNSTNAELAVSGGRGGSAAADWAANKNIALPDAKGRTLIGTGTGSGLTARTNMDTGGAEDVAITEAELPSNITVTVETSTASSPSAGINSLWGISSTPASTVANVDLTSVGSGNAHNNMQPWLATHFIIKL